MNYEHFINDIAAKINILDDFAIAYGDREPIILPDELQQRFTQLPEDIRNEYLQVKLQALIQEIYYTKDLNPSQEEEGETVENSAVKWSKSPFVRDLQSKNHSQGYFQPGWSIVGASQDGLLQVKKDDLILHIEAERHLAPTQQNAEVGDFVAVKMPPQLLEPGCYIAIGNAGSLKDLIIKNEQIVDIYFNINADGGLALMDGITEELNKLELVFHFQVLYNRDDYAWYDSASLSFARRDYKLVRSTLDRIYQKNQTYFQPEIPPFTKYLAPGLSLAERPNSAISFRQHRCKIVALGSIEAWQTGKKSVREKVDCIINQFKQAEIDFERPYLNPNSSDIYRSHLDRLRQ
jgi:hypothetical protein